MEQQQIKRHKLCFAASSGGHLEQIMRLYPLMKKYPSILVTEKTDYAVPPEDVKTCWMRQVNRREWSCIPKLIANMMRAIWILLRERPDTVITTGVLAVLPLCLLAKLMGKKLIYIESFAKVNSPTRTGRLLYHFADQFYVQWKSMLKVYPEAIYVGSIY